MGWVGGVVGLLPEGGGGVVVEARGGVEVIARRLRVVVAGGVIGEEAVGDAEARALRPLVLRSAWYRMHEVSATGRSLTFTPYGDGVRAGLKCGLP